MTRRTRALARGGIAALLVVVASGCGEEATPVGRVTDLRTVVPDGGERLGPYPRSQFYVERDLFLAADEPATLPAADARFLSDDDEVLGFVIRAKARAYAVTMLSFHHVVNDVVEGIPVAVTY